MRQTDFETKADRDEIQLSTDDVDQSVYLSIAKISKYPASTTRLTKQEAKTLAYLLLAYAESIQE